VDLARYALERLGVDENGFDALDRKFLDSLVVQFSGGPVGVDTLASATGEESDTLENVVEPYLIQEGFVQRTPRGRIATQHAFHYLDVALPDTGGAQVKRSHPAERDLFNENH
jgi:Holliday junction DNA helicase RuvB